MKKKYLLLILLLTVSFISFSQVNNPLQEHIDAGKKAYIENANPQNHLEIKNSRSPINYNVGDTKTFWRYNLSVMPPTWIETPATCRAVGELSYIFVADDQWNISMNQEDVDLAMSFLEDSTLNTTEYGIVAMDTLLFGAIPDELDADPKVTFFYSELGSFNGTLFDGYFSAFNQMTETEAQQYSSHSNECEMLYMSCNPVNPTSISTMSVLSHELQHLIHWGADTNEESWVNEGCSELAMVMFGQADPIVDFPSNPNNNLISWDQHFSDYVQVMLFFTYLYEQFNEDIIKQIVISPQTGIAGIDDAFQTLGIDTTFVDVFTNWTVANYIDDNIFEQGEYGYSILNLPTFSSNVLTGGYPMNQSSTIEDVASKYYTLDTDFGFLNIAFTTDNSAAWDIKLLTYDASGIQEVIKFNESLTLDFAQPTAYTLSKVVLAVTNKSTGLNSDDFSFEIGELANISNLSTNLNVSIYPNPVTSNTNLYFSLENKEKVKVQLFSINGKLESSIFEGELNSGKHEINFSSQNLEAGIYFVKLTTNKTLTTKKIIIE